MTDQPLQGAALYNPHLQSKDELIGLFTVRQDLLDQLLEDLRRTSAGNTPQHHLIVGQRGMGKTTLLRRLAFAIEDDSELSATFLALTFPEEQYNVSRLSDFWLNCTDALSDSLERLGHTIEAEELDQRAATLPSADEAQRSRRALRLLTEAGAVLGRRLVLLVDNVDLILDRIHQQEWALREALSAESTIVLIGASASAIESSYSYGQAFYDFFRIHELEGLDLEETRRLIVHYAEIWKAPDVKRIAEEDPVRVRVLHNLAGGNPRTIALLFNVLSVGIEGDVQSDLERLLDQCTPLYKARLEALPPQSQQVVHALAIHWDPSSAGELAESSRLDVNTVSSQLNRLTKQGVVEKVAYDPESKTGFQIAERFFNIWYLMRASRRVRRRLLWLVEFLKIFYSQEQLRAKALAHIQAALSLEPSFRLRYAQYSFALADAIDDHAWKRSLERSGLHVLVIDDSLRNKLNELVDLESQPDLKRRAQRRQRMEDSKAGFIAAGVEIPGWAGEAMWDKLRDSLLFSSEEKLVLAENSSAMPAELLRELKDVLEDEEENLQFQYSCPKTIEALSKAIHTGLMAGLWDFEGALEAESILGITGLPAIALANRLDFEADPSLLASLEKRLKGTSSPYPWAIWLQRSLELEHGPSQKKFERAIDEIAELVQGKTGLVYKFGEELVEKKRFDEAARLYQKFLDRNPERAEIWEELGKILGQWLGRNQESEVAFRKSLEIDPRRSFSWRGLGNVLADTNRHAEAEDAYRRALALDPEDAGAWSAWGIYLLDLKRHSEAEEALRRAVAQSPRSVELWNLLGGALGSLGRHAEAEQTFRKGSELDPENAEAWLNLGIAIWIQERSSEAVSRIEASDRLREAEKALRRAVALALERTRPKLELAWFLLLERNFYRESSKLAEEIAREEPEAFGILASAFAHFGNWPEALVAARKFVHAMMERDLKGRFTRTIVFFREAVHAGRIKEAVAILEETGAAERWRPLREALEVIARGSESYLRRVAPEVRLPAREIMNALLLKSEKNTRKAKRKAQAS